MSLPDTNFSPSEDLPPFDTIIADLKAGTATQVWQALAAHAAADTGLSADYILERLKESEARTPSGVGHGVAIIALRSPKIDIPHTMFARTPRRIDIGSIDGNPADLFFLMLSPAGDVAGHLQRLSRLSRAMRNDTLCRQLRDVANEDGLSALFLASRAVTRAA